MPANRTYFGSKYQRRSSFCSVLTLLRNISTSITHSSAHLYLARRLTFVKPGPDNTEEIQTVKLKLEKAVEKVISGEITHSQTCVLILKIDRYLRNNSNNVPTVFHNKMGFMSGEIDSKVDDCFL